MKCLILAAGYATRLYPLTENFPKPLLKVGEKTILDWLIDDISTIAVDGNISPEGERLVDEFIVISNHKFARHFKQWAASCKAVVSVVDDMTDSNESRLGAVKDISFAIKEKNVKDDMLVIAGDNVLDFSLTRFISYAKDKKTSCVMRYYEADEKRLSKCGVLKIDSDDRILEMEEKPQKPESNWCCPPFYFYRSQDAALIDKAIEEGCGVDAPGSLVVWMSSKVTVHAMEMPGSRYDIGNLESYRQVSETYKGITK